MKVNYNSNACRLPDFLIVGAPKSGTTSVYFYLKEKKEIFFPEIKEPHFFSFYKRNKNFKSPDPLEHISDFQQYVNQYKTAIDSQLLGDGSQSYLYEYENTIKNLKEIYGNDYKKIKIFIFLRNPIERAWSQYWHFKKNYLEDLSFEDAIKKEVIEERMKNDWNVFYNYIGFGKYVEQIKAYQENFNNVKIFLFEDIKKEPSKVLLESMKFLGLKENETSLNENKSFKIYNPSGKPKKNFLGLIWRLNKKFKFFELVKKLPFTKKFKTKLNFYLMSKVMVRQKMPESVKLEVQPIFEEEIKELYNLLKREEILNWIKKNTFKS